MRYCCQGKSSCTGGKVDAVLLSREGSCTVGKVDAVLVSREGLLYRG